MTELIAVFTADSTECRLSTPIRLPAFYSTIGHIASLVTHETGCCGTDGSPWLIEALPGQRINITLLDFGLQTGQIRLSKVTAGRSSEGRLISASATSGFLTSYGGESTGSCQNRYALIRERSTSLHHRTSPGGGGRSVEVCGGRGLRQKHVYLSYGHVVEISVDARRNNPDYFILSYEGRFNFDTTLELGVENVANWEYIV